MSDDMKGYAFPGVCQPSGCPVQPGMSLRDYFAGQALAGFIASHSDDMQPPGDDYAAESAYEYADAMLAERAKTRP